MWRSENGNWIVNYPIACLVLATFLIGVGTEVRWIVAILYWLNR